MRWHIHLAKVQKYKLLKQAIHIRQFNSYHQNIINLLENLKAAPTSLAVGKGTLAMMQKELETQQTRIQEEVIENYRYVLNMY